MITMANTHHGSIRLNRRHMLLHAFVAVVSSEPEGTQSPGAKLESKRPTAGAHCSTSGRCGIMMGYNAVAGTCRLPTAGNPTYTTDKVQQMVAAE